MTTLSNLCPFILVKNKQTKRFGISFYNERTGKELTDYTWESLGELLKITAAQVPFQPDKLNQGLVLGHMDMETFVKAHV